MAQRVLNVVERLLECPVCIDRMTADSRLLPCQHTVCWNCLNDIVNTTGSLTCPECRTLVRTPIDRLPHNMMLVRLLDGLDDHPAPPIQQDAVPPVQQNPQQLPALPHPPPRQRAPNAARFHLVECLRPDLQNPVARVMLQPVRHMGPRREEYRVRQNPVGLFDYVQREAVNLVALEQFNNIVHLQNQEEGREILRQNFLLEERMEQQRLEIVARQRQARQMQARQIPDPPPADVGLDLGRGRLAEADQAMADQGAGQLWPVLRFQQLPPVLQAQRVPEVQQLPEALQFHL